MNKHTHNYSTTRLLCCDTPTQGTYKSLFSVANNAGLEGGLRCKGFFKKSYLHKPLVSIVTVVYNRKKYVEQTIQSVLQQSYDNVEYIIVDGGSSDGTLDIIKKYDHAIDYWISEPDEGIYDAMNKGIKLCCGELIGLLNSDDYYQNDAIDNLIQVYTNNTCCKKAVYHGGIHCIKKNKNLYTIHATENVQQLIRYMIINHPATFIPAKVYTVYGVYSTEYVIGSDWDLMLTLYYKKIRFIPIKEVITNFRKEGISSHFSFSHLIEDIKIRKNNKLKKTIYYRYFIVYFLLRIFGDTFVHSLIKIKNFISQKI